MSEMPVMVKVKRMQEENHNTKTIFLDTAGKAEPGQFLMVWLPGEDEKPISISYLGKELGITVQERGPFSKKLLDVEEGELVGIRGPYGRGFGYKGKGVEEESAISEGTAGAAENAAQVERTGIVTGGCGCAPVAPLAELLQKKPVVILGARSNTELMMSKRYGENSELYITTDDGSAGEKGFTTDILERMLKEGREFDKVYTCGPEVMMKKVFEICEKHGVECEASLERYMSCGFGICGQCACGDRLVCKDGPVFGSAELRGMKEFGQSARVKSGKLVGLKEYGR